MKILLTLLALILLISCGGGSNGSSEDVIVKIPGSGTERYKITFNMTWSSATHPAGFPTGAHFSPIIGATHTINTILWQEDDLASSGIEQMAETGGTSELIKIIDDLKINALSDIKIMASGISSSPGSTSLILSVNDTHPYLTLVTMLAPSPDWFAGITGYNLKPNDTWVIKETITLYAYDSGTDDGINYTAANANSNPQQLITKITASPFLVNKTLVPIGEVIVEKM